MKESFFNNKPILSTWNRIRVKSLVRLPCLLYFRNTYIKVLWQLVGLYLLHVCHYHWTFILTTRKMFKCLKLCGTITSYTSVCVCICLPHLKCSNFLPVFHFWTFLLSIQNVGNSNRHDILKTNFSQRKL